MSSRPPQDQIVLTADSTMATLDAAQIRGLYEWLVERMGAMGVLPTHVAVNAPGQPQLLRSFARIQKKVSALDWSVLNGFTLRSCRPERNVQNYAFFDWTSSAGASRDHAEAGALPADRPWHASWSIALNDGGPCEQITLDELMQFARRTVTRYGYVYWMERSRGPGMYSYGLQLATAGRPDDQNRNIGAWAYRRQHYQYPLLRDVYPINFLTQPYLALPVGGTTLADWIQLDSGRGTLESLTDQVVTWRPMAGNIPAIREEVFRAGILFYWRFFDKSDPLYRDFTRPFVVPEPIPEIFRATFFHNRDPKLTL